MPHLITKYACNYCGRAYSTKSNAGRHEKDCFYDDRNRACVTCAHLIASANDRFAQEFGEVVFCGTSYDVACNIEKDLEDTGMCNGSIERHFRTHCPLWERRTLKGEYKFGKAMIELA